ncbi:DNA-binding response regulator [Pseudonocardiaceae bacterium YIM PH 21723]|nr:DNA-binding response regulator [Pseudonocardiaceae bacterium YIM PH 21723]
MITVLICDDAPIVRLGLRMLLDAEPDMTVVAEAGDGDEALDLVDLHRPDVLLLDLTMPKLDGLAVIRRAPDTRILVLSTYEPPENIHAALGGGARGFLVKNSPGDQLLQAIRAVAAGQAWLSPSVTSTLLETVLMPVKDPRLTGLSERDIALLRLLGRGWSNAEIAAELGLTVNTAKTYVARLLATLEVRDRTQAAILAHEAGYC